MDRVMAVVVFNRICELGSLSAASRALGISRPMVSRYLDEMEKWAGARLIHRSSRRLTLTPAGENTLQKTRQLAPLFGGIEGQSTRETPSGTLRVACAHFTASHIIGPVLPDFLARYPALRIEVEVGNHPVNLIGERIDLAIRITNNPEAGAIATRLGECRSVLCASADYLRLHGTPHTVHELAHHNCLHYSGFAGQSWHFTDGAQNKWDVMANGNLSAGISAVLRDAAIAGCGLALVPEREAQDALNNGQLVGVLPDLEPQRLGIYGLYQSREHQHAALRLFMDAIRQQLTSAPE
ncbi:LysR family transcriptional regulator [Kosakonia pseudosacchari]|uniref:LysR family transcriptional regulator n=1 Tax=Kosakonia pseudosacchari TaxID=1646340 RepID=UPI001882C158|nr:LysR family transcriptional regulator [Kosakonia pseudosacchari]QOV65195.1 LysR family transcriptional regulator [Kosakonia pseudosacchari]